MSAKFKITEEVFCSFIRTQGLFRNVMEAYFLHFGISGAQWGILRNLHRHESKGFEGMKLKELGEHLLIRPPSVTGVVDGLERLGFVTRTPSSNDQRAKQVKLTCAGRQLVQRVLKQHGSQMQTVLGGLNLREQKKFHFLTNKLSDHLESFSKPSKGEKYEHDQ